MIQLGIIGTGAMANAHANAFRSVADVNVAACCDVDEARAEEFARKWKIPSWYTSDVDMMRKEKLQAVSVVVPDKAHADVVLRAIKERVHVFCEKPLADSVANARKMEKALGRKALVTMVNYTYRDCAGLQGLADYIKEGKVGSIRHVEAVCLQGWLVARSWGDWRKRPAWLWRLSSKHGSLGALGDLGSNLYDILRFTVGDAAEVGARIKTFDKGVKGDRIGDYLLDANDSFSANLIFRNGAMGVMHATRWAVGHMNTLRLSVYGDEGAVRFDLEQSPHSFQCIRGRMNIDRAEWATVPCKTYPTAYERFCESIRSGKTVYPNFKDGIEAQEFVQACLTSDRKRSVVKLA